MKVTKHIKITQAAVIMLTVILVMVSIHSLEVNCLLETEDTREGYLYNEEESDNYITPEQSIYNENDLIKIFVVIKDCINYDSLQTIEDGFHIINMAPQNDGAIFSLTSDLSKDILKLSFFWEDYERHEMSLFGIRENKKVYVSQFSIESCYDVLYHEAYMNHEISFAEYEEAMASTYTRLDAGLYSEVPSMVAEESDDPLRGITVSGTIRWKDDSGNYHPLQYTKVTLINNSTSGSLGTTYTSSSGYYSITSNTSASSVNIKVSAQTSYVKATNASNVVYSINSNAYNCTGTTTINLDFTMATEAGQSLQLLQGANTFARYASAMGGYTLDMVRIVYPRTDGTGFVYSNSDKTIYAYKDTTHNLKSYAAWDVIMHEYGHYLEHKIGLTGGYSGAHSITADLPYEYNYNKTKSINLAWSESWNTVVGIMAQQYYANSLTNIATVGDSIYTPYSSNGGSFNLETNPNKLGECCEACVMGLLYDLYDSDSDSNDYISLGHSVFWSYSCNSGAKTANAFIQYLISNNYVSEGNLGRLLMQHGFAVDNIIKGGSETNPTFQWTRRNSQTYYNKKFVIKFYNGSNVVIKQYTVTNANSLTVSSTDWTYIQNHSGAVIRMVIVAYQTDSPTTGGFPGQIMQYTYTRKGGGL